MTSSNKNGASTHGKAGGHATRPFHLLMSRSGRPAEIKSELAAFWRGEPGEGLLQSMKPSTGGVPSSRSRSHPSLADRLGESHPPAPRLRGPKPVITGEGPTRTLRRIGRAKCESGAGPARSSRPRSGEHRTPIRTPDQRAAGGRDRSRSGYSVSPEFPSTPPTAHPGGGSSSLGCSCCAWRRAGSWDGAGCSPIARERRWGRQRHRRKGTPAATGRACVRFS